VKLIKLDRRHNLYHKGYRYAFLIDRWSSDSNRIEKAIKELEGWRWDSTFWGKSKFNRTKKESQSCSDIISRTMGDIHGTELTTFTSRCPQGFRKVCCVVDKNRDYHWYRQDNNGMWSHKPGTRAVTDIDAFGSKIYNPELASRNYPAEFDGDTGLNYQDFCSFMCIPAKPGTIQIAGKR
jgi:hypothetical protein